MRHFDKIAELEGKSPFQVVVGKDSQIDARLRTLAHNMTEEFSEHSILFSVDLELLAKSMAETRMKAGKRLYKAVVEQVDNGCATLFHATPDVKQSTVIKDFLKTDEGVIIVAKLGEQWERTSPITTPIYVDVVRGLHWKQGDFGDYKSCFWSERPEARRIMDEIGVYSIRLMTDSFEYAYNILARYSHASELYSSESIKGQMEKRAERYDGLYGFGRALIADVKPYTGNDYTGMGLHDKSDWGVRRDIYADCVAVFNAYPKLWRLWHVAHIVSTIVGTPIIKEIKTESDDMRMYVNNNKSVLMGNAQITNNAYILFDTYSVGRDQDYE